MMIGKIFTRTLSGMEQLSYEERLDKLYLFSLEQRKLRGDTVDVYPIMRVMAAGNVPHIRSR